MSEDKNLKYACIAGAVTGTMGLFLIWWNRNKLKAPKKKLKVKVLSGEKKEKNKKKKRTPKAPKIPPPQELITRITDSMRNLQSTGNIEESKELMEVIKQVNPKDMPPQVALAGAQWLILRNTIQQMKTPPAARSIFEKISREDMEVAWRLLQLDSENAQESRAIDILCVDVAQRLCSPLRLAGAYNNVMKRGDQMNQEEILVTFTTAPLLGKWEDTAWLGKQVEARQGGLDDFHLAAIQDKTLPDYKVLFDLARSDDADIQKVLTASTANEDLVWTTRHLTSFRMKPVAVETEDEEKKSKMEDKINEDTWNDVPPNRFQLKIEGGLCSMLGITEYGLKLCGPFSPDALFMRNYVDLRMPDGNTVKQVEVYSLSRLEGDRWKGQYVLQQVKGDKKDSFTMKFDLEVVLG